MAPQDRGILNGAGDIPAEFELDLPRGGSWKIGSRPALMGILNCTPDSFSDGGRYGDV